MNEYTKRIRSFQYAICLGPDYMQSTSKASMANIFQSFSVIPKQPIL